MKFSVEQIFNLFNTLSGLPDELKPNEKTFDSVEAEYKEVKASSGGVSGASVFMLKPSAGKPDFLKLYDNSYISDKGDQIIREIYALIKISIGFHKNESADKVGIGYPIIISHGIMDTNKYYFMMSAVEGEPLYKTVTASTSSRLSNNVVTWSKKENVLLFSEYLLKAIYTLFLILGSNFSHRDLHPDNIFVATDKTTHKITSVSIIDFDLISSDYFNTDLRPILGYTFPDYANSGHKTVFDNFVFNGITPKVRRFICFCYDYENKTRDIDFKWPRLWNPPCFQQISIVSHSTGINHIDIRHWYVTVVSLIHLMKVFNPGRKVRETAIKNSDLKNIYDKYIDKLVEKPANNFINSEFDFNVDPYGTYYTESDKQGLTYLQERYAADVEEYQEKGLDEDFVDEQGEDPDQAYYDELFIQEMRGGSRKKSRKSRKSGKSRKTRKSRKSGKSRK